MGSLYCPNITLNIQPPPPPDAKIGLGFSPSHLADCGLNFPVAVFPSKAAPPDDKSEEPTQSAVVYAHFDTGATISSIDRGLAAYLKLKPTGMSSMMTAGGRQEVPNYVIDLHFPGSGLSPFIRLPIASCQLEFDVNAEFKNPRNFAMLIGRDVMSRWNITWNGPVSTVTIND
jgi:hypothetical protein